jgi:hypothetical protein
MEEHDGEIEQIILKNYEQEFEKIENVSTMLIQMITDHKERL